MIPPWALGPLVRLNTTAPILRPNAEAVFHCPMRQAPVHWEKDHVFNPAAVFRDGKVYVLFRAEDDSGQGIGEHTSRIGLAESDDGVHFHPRPKPVLFPADDAEKAYEWPGGCEDPRVVEGPNGEYVMTYTAWDRKTARLSIATSKDLIHWIKHGPAFAGTTFLNTWSKSGAIVTSVQDAGLKAAQINHLYWMYWGEGTLHLAVSDDLIRWSPVVDDSGAPISVLTTRPGFFDSALVEPGPPAVLTKDGIVLIYNGKNADKGGDTSVDSGAYCAGQALFDAQDPSKLLDRTASYFLEPELAFERTGQYAAGTVFTEGLVLFKGAWLLFFGAADSFVNAAVWKPAR